MGERVGDKGSDIVIERGGEIRRVYIAHRVQHILGRTVDFDDLAGVVGDWLVYHVPVDQRQGHTQHHHRPYAGRQHPIDCDLVGDKVRDFTLPVSAISSALPPERGQRVQPQFGVPPVPDSSAAHGHRGHNLARAVLGPLFPKFRQHRGLPAILRLVLGHVASHIPGIPVRLNRINFGL